MRTGAWRRPRRGLLVSAAALSVFAGMALVNAPADAVPGGTYFELDGNAVDDSAVSGLDWSNSALASLCDITSCTAPTVAATGIVDDLPADLTGTDSTFFQGGGSKDDLDISSWGTGGNGAPDKNELTNAYAAATRDSNNKLVVVFGADRYDNSGSAQMGFWLLKGTVKPGATKFVDGNGDPAVHQVGDVLVLSDFTNGGQLGQIIIYKWVGVGQGNAGSNNVLQELARASTNPTKSNPDPVNAADCTYTGSNPTPNNTTFCATINRVGGETAPWTYKNKDSADPNKVSTTFPARTFIEGAVNIGVLTGGDCFASYLAETRTAPEIQGAQLKDYALGSFAICKPTTTMKNTAMSSNTTSGTAHLNQSVTYTAYEKNDGTDPLTSPSVTGTGCTTWTKGTGDSTTTGTVGVLDPGEEWSFTCTTSYSTAGTKTVTVFGHGLDARFGNKDVTYCATPDTTKVCDADETNTISILVIAPSTTLTNTAATVSKDPILKNENVTYTFYEKNDGDAVLATPSVTTHDANCATATSKNKTDDLSTTGVNESLYNVGDTNNDGNLDPGEEFTFTCTTSYSVAGSQTINAVGHGYDPLGADVTFYTVTGGGNCTAGAITTGSSPKLCDLQERTSKSVLVVNPSTHLFESAVAVVTFTYKETNDGDSVITSPYVNSTCSGSSANATETKKTQDPNTSLDETLYNVGDSNNNGKLEVSETWTFTCTKTVSIASGSTTVTYTDSSTGHGTDATGQTIDNTTDTDEADSSTVTVTDNAPNP